MIIIFKATLAEAQAKLPRAAENSDLSTTEDEVKKYKKKKFNSPLKIKNCPPSYKDFCSKG